MKKGKRKPLIWIIGAVGAAAIVVVVLAVTNKKPDAPAVEILEVGPGAVVATVSADGDVEARDQVDISAEVVARVEKIYVKEGDAVRAGQLLCVLNDDELRSERDLNLAQLEQTEAAYRRGRTLFEEGLISAAELEDRRAAYGVARAQLERSNNELGKTRIYAPIGGRVIRVEVEVGETVVMGTMNNAGTVLFTLGDLSALQARVYVDETDVANCALGQPAVVTLDALPGVEYEATVIAIGYMPATDAAAVSDDVTEFEVILELANADARLRPGMTATAIITTAAKNGVLTCPLQSLGMKKVDGKVRDTVFILENGRAKVVSVDTGISDGTNVEVIAGLKTGAKVIAGPYKTLRALSDGDAVGATTPFKEGKWSQKDTGPRSATATSLMRIPRGRR